MEKVDWLKKGYVDEPIEKSVDLKAENPSLMLKKRMRLF